MDQAVAQTVGPRKPRRGDELEIEVLGFSAKGGLRGRYLGPTGEYTVELRRGVPGERAVALVLFRRAHVLRARILRTLAPGPQALEPRCRHFVDCGGCAHQDLAYTAQLIEKQRVAERVLAAHLDLSLPGAACVEAPIACEVPWRYRNKMEFTFAARRWIEAHEPIDVAADERGFALGLHPLQQFAKVLDITSCDITFQEVEGILASVRELARARELSAWDIHSQSGLLRHLVVRRSWARGEILVNLVTAEEAPQVIGPYVAELLARHPEITTLVQTVNTGLAKTSLGEREILLFGPGVLVEELGGHAFRLSARSFFQTNTPQAERLLACVLAAAALQPTDVVYDLYCGVGALSLSLAREARQVVGFELSAEAVADARDNAAANGVLNVEFVSGDVAETLVAGERPRANVVVVDPPRSGLFPSVTAALLAAAPARLVYVSCNLKTAARDIALLVAQGFELTRIQPIDLFPHTPHLECVFTLTRRP